MNLLRIRTETSDCDLPLVKIEVGECHPRSLVELVVKNVGFSRGPIFVTTQLEGTPRKLMDSIQLRRMGWHPTISLKQGLEAGYSDFAARQV